MDIQPFVIPSGSEQVKDLRERIARPRWPEPSPGERWAQGTDLEVLRELLAAWADFQWPPPGLTALPHFRAEVDGLNIHFVHLRRGGTPLILTHGWPSTFAEMLPLVPLLDGFDLVIPSLPGYAFSGRPQHPHTTHGRTLTWGGPSPTTSASDGQRVTDLRGPDGLTRTWGGPSPTGADPHRRPPAAATWQRDGLTRA